MSTHFNTVPTGDEIHIDFRLTLKKVTEQIVDTETGTVVDAYTHLIPASLQVISRTGEADADELYDAAETIAETDDWLETFANGSLDLIHSDEPHEFTTR